MNNRGFTLIELIAVIAIMGILMLVSIPNINSMIDKRKRSAYLQDAKKMVQLVEYKFETKVLEVKPSHNYCKVYLLRDLDKTELSSPPNGGTYDLNRSYVVIEYSNPYYVYNVQLVEKYDVSSGLNKTVTMYRGVKYTDSKNLDNENSKMKNVTSGLDYNTYQNSFLDVSNHCAVNRRV